MALGALWLVVLPLVGLIPLPSERLFTNVAGIGATLLVAFAIEATWLVKTSHKTGPRREEWLGFVSWTGVAGLLGIAVSLSLAEHLAAGHRNWIDHAGLAWVITSLGMLGLLVAIQPLMTYAWRRSEDDD